MTGNRTTTAERQPPAAALGSLPAWMHDVVRRACKASTHFQVARATPLAGGVSSDIYRVDVDGFAFCVKRALPKLKVAADWQAPVERNRYEVAWLRTAASIAPGAVPRVLAEDAAAGAFAMSWLPPDRYPVWKAQLADGAIDESDAARVGDLLGTLHAATADRADLADAFATGAAFEAIRIEPYLLATGRAHPDLADRFDALARRTRSTQRTLVHGDFSPKNVLIGPDGPVILDAECAWYGDPAFDLAFVLNHLLLKGAWRPQWRRRYLAAFAALVAAYQRRVAWERWTDLEDRTCALLPALLLARIDGKSPVEYLTDSRAREAVRAFARTRIEQTPASLAALTHAWSNQ